MSRMVKVDALLLERVRSGILYSQLTYRPKDSHDLEMQETLENNFRDLYNSQLGIEEWGIEVIKT